MTTYRPTDFKDRWIVISGATSGIGKVICSALASLNANLILIGRSQKKLDSVLSQSSPARYKTVKIDLEDSESFEKLEYVFSETGKIYGLCHCAGVIDSRPLSTTHSSVISKQLSVNLLAGVELARIISKRKFTSLEGGSLLFISSIYAHIGAPAQIGYCASKGAINAMVKAMAIELAPKNIRVNSVSPGFITTDMTTEKSRLTKTQIEAIVDRHPLGEGSPMDIARAAAFLLDPNNRWITGTDLIIDGGYTSQ